MTGIEHQYDTEDSMEVDDDNHHLHNDRSFEIAHGGHDEAEGRMFASSSYGSSKTATAGSALNASFDLSLLLKPEHMTQPAVSSSFAPAESSSSSPPGIRAAASWDEHESTAKKQICPHIRKHRHHHPQRRAAIASANRSNNELFSIDMPELSTSLRRSDHLDALAPSGGSSSRHGLLSSTLSTSSLDAIHKTPLRMRVRPQSSTVSKRSTLAVATGGSLLAAVTSKPTPTSAKRRKGGLLGLRHAKRPSPLRRGLLVPPKTPRDSTRSYNSDNQHSARSATTSVHDARISHLAVPQEVADEGKASGFAPQQQSQATPFPLFACQHKAPASSSRTGNTASSATALETTSDTVDSLDTENSCSSSTPFRFASFPASLPRIQLQGTSGAASNTNSNHQRPSEAPAAPMTVRKRMSFGDEWHAPPLSTGRVNTAANPATGEDDDGGTHNTSFTTSSFLLPEDDGNYFGYSDDDDDGAGGANPNTRGNLEDDEEEENDHQAYSRTCSYDGSTATSSPIATPVARTRLKFNMSAAAPFFPRKSFQREQHDGAARPCENGCAMQVDAEKDLLASLENTRFNSFASSISSYTTNKNGPNTSSDDLYTSSTAAITPSRASGPADLSSRLDAQPQTPREVQLHFQLDAAQCSPIPGIPEEDLGDLSSPSDLRNSRRDKKSSLPPAASKLSQSRDSMDSSSSRPLPDMNAFDADVFRDRSVDESATRSHASSPKLLCPPTPVRTPAWAQGDFGNTIFKPRAYPKVARSNSLIATKLLATCNSDTDLPDALSSSSACLRTDFPYESRTEGSKVMPRNDPLSSVREGRAAVKWQGRSSLTFCDLAMPSIMSDPVSGVSGPSNASKMEEAISMTTSFEVLSSLGSGVFADVYKVRSKIDGRLYAVKKNRRQFRGRRDREAALAECRSMQRLQNVPLHKKEDKSDFSRYLLFFYRAWQEEGFFFCQTELCCRDTCHDLIGSLRSHWNVAKKQYLCLKQLPAPPGVVGGSDVDVQGRLMPESTIWKVCHDISAGLHHVHSQGMVHNDIKPSNIFFADHVRFGTLCKIGDFGMARKAGSLDDGQEGDQKYMAAELLTSGLNQTSSDIFSLGLTLYEMASHLCFALPLEGRAWHELRSGKHSLQIPNSRSSTLMELLSRMLHPDPSQRPTADAILSLPQVQAAGERGDSFLSSYVYQVEEYDAREAERASLLASSRLGVSGVVISDEWTPRTAPRVRVVLCSPSATHDMTSPPCPPLAPLLFSPQV